MARILKHAILNVLSEFNSFPLASLVSYIYLCISTPRTFNIQPRRSQSQGPCSLHTEWSKEPDWRQN